MQLKTNSNNLMQLVNSLFFYCNEVKRLLADIIYYYYCKKRYYIINYLRKQVTDPNIMLLNKQKIIKKLIEIKVLSRFI